MVSQMALPTMAAAGPVKERRIARRRSGRSLNIVIVCLFAGGFIGTRENQCNL